MAMTYTSLTGGKGVSGSIANWVSYTLLDLPPIIDEAQALIYQILRCREMKTAMSFSIPQGGVAFALPARFLDPIGRIYSTTNNDWFRHLDDSSVLAQRNFQETSGALGTDPFTTTLASTQVSVALAAHGFNAGSVFNISGASVVGGLTLNGTFEIVTVSTNSFVIETKALVAASASTTGGGASVTYFCDSLTQGYPQIWSIWDEKLQFDAAFPTRQLMQMQYFQAPPLLSATNQSNFLTDRYPQIMRTACAASAADFMQDDGEYQKQSTRLATLVQTAMVENDGMYRGAEIMTENP